MPVCVWVAARSRLAEDWLITSDAEQYVILGAGLDSFAWRQLERARVFEVDEGVVGPWDARLWHDRPSIRLPGYAECRYAPKPQEGSDAK